MQTCHETINLPNRTCLISSFGKVRTCILLITCISFAPKFPVENVCQNNGNK